MGQTVSQTDYDYVYTEEPHASRRKEILAKHPEMKKLMTHDPMLKYSLTGLVIAQIIAAYLLQDASWLTIAVVGYCFGGVCNHALELAIHEISHNLAFGHLYPMANKLLGIFGNMPIGLPYSVTFKKYHLEHHKYQGDEEYDMDIPSRLEGYLFHNTFTKLLWVILQPVFYALRPVFMRPKPIQGLDILNLVVQFSFDAVIVYTMGWRSLAYLIGGTFLAMGAHPVAGHFVSEHYVFVKGYETYSYYGPLNMVTYNVGYHNEHHDFPNIPGCNLPEVKKIAPEFYDNLPCHTSWTKVLYDFVMDPTIGPYSRVRRRKRVSNPENESEKDQ